MQAIEHTKQRLDNWSKWARTSRHYRVTPSLEGRYKCPPSWHPREPKVFIDTLDAVVIEKALVNPSFPRKSRELIKYAYIESGKPIDVACRKIGINKRNFDDELQTAIRMLHNRLNK